MSAPDASAGRLVDARGLRCPLPVVRLAQAARETGPGVLLTVLATDPAARLDVPAWARMRGYRMVREELLEAVPGDDDAAATWALTVTRDA